MKMDEFLLIKDMTYREYCDYLQDKYGIGLADYMTKSYNKNPKCSRTKEGLFAHHKDEDKMIMLSHKEYAMNCPFEWQRKENIVYCDYLEHLWLHILICKYPSSDKMQGAMVGVGGIVNFIVPELNDYYCGWRTDQPWKKTCLEKIKDDKDVYFAMLKEYIRLNINKEHFNYGVLYSSFNEKFGLWKRSNNCRIGVILRKLKRQVVREENAKKKMAK